MVICEAVENVEQRSTNQVHPLEIVGVERYHHILNTRCASILNVVTECQDVQRWQGNKKRDDLRCKKGEGRKDRDTAEVEIHGRIHRDELTVHQGRPKEVVQESAGSRWF